MMDLNFRDLTDIADSLYDNGEYEDALKKYLELLNSSIELSDSEFAETVNNIGHCHYASEEYEKALKQFLLIYEKLSAQSDAEKGDLGRQLISIGNTYYNLSNNTKAIETYTEALNVYVEIEGNITENVANLNMNIGHCYFNQESYTEAEYSYQIALEIYNKIEDIDTETVIELYINISNCYDNIQLSKENNSAEIDDKILINNFALANRYFNNNYNEKALNLFIVLHKYKADNPDDERFNTLEELLGKITTLCLVNNKFEKTEKYFIELYNSAKSAHGLEHFDTTTGASKLGQYYYKIESYKKAKEYFAISYEFRCKTLGKEDNYTLSSAEWLRTVLTYLDGWREAEKFYKDILEIKRRLLEEDSPKLLSSIINLARIYYELDEYSKSEELCSEAVTKSENIHGSNSTKTLNAKFDLSDVYYYSEKYNNAIELLKKMLEEYLAENEEDGASAKIMRKLGNNFSYLPDKSKEAEYYFKKAIDIYENNIELKDYYYFKLHYDLGYIYAFQLDNYYEAEKSFQLIVENSKSNVSNDSWLIIKSLIYLGELNFNQFKRNEIAVEYFHKALKIITTSERNNDSNKIKINHYLVKILFDNDEQDKAKILMKETIEFAKLTFGIKHENTKPLIAFQIQKFPTSSFSQEITEEYRGTLSPNDYSKNISEAFRSESYSKKVRVFISSTFRDMMPEREYLMKNVFPKLRKLCRSNGFDFTEVDLRWGITEKDAENGKVIEICLNEIDKSRPFFIGIIGERYGWVPEYEDSSNFKKMLNNYDWLENDVQSGLSVTEMEVQYGVLRNPAMKGNAFFYIRDRNITPNDSSFYEVKDSPEHKKLEKLKSQLQEQDSFPCTDYNSIEELGNYIFENLRKAIFGDESSENKSSDLDEAREKQINFVKSYSDFYIPDSKTSRELHQFATSKSNIFLKQSNKLVVYGKSGIGKTALLANFVKEQYLNNGENPLLFHFVEADQDSKKSGEIIKRIIGEINLFSFTGLDFQDVEHQNPAPILEDVFKKTENEIVIIIDGLEKIWTHDFFSRLYWLPENIPSNVKLILSTNNEELFNSLKQSGYKSITIDMLGKSQRESFIISYLEKFGKKLPTNVVKTIAKDEISLLPFSLKLLLDEARIFGVFEDLNDFIDNYLSANNNVELFTKLFERMEGDYEDNSKGLVGNVLSFIALSKHGLTENEIVEFAESAPLYWSPIYNSIENYLYRNIGQLSIRNREFAEAVKIKYLTDEKAIKIIHHKMANYFDKIDDKARKFDELSYHLKELDNHEKLMKHLSDIEILMLYFRSNPVAIIKYWDELKKHYDFTETYKTAIIEYEKQEYVNPKEVVEAATKIAKLAGSEGKYENSLFFVEKAFHITENLYGSDHLETAKALSSLCMSYQVMQEYGKAEKYALKGLEIFEKNNVKNMKYASILSTLGDIYIAFEKYELAEEYLLRVQKVLKTIWGGDNFAIIDPYLKLAQISLAKDDLSKAVEYCKISLDIIERFGGNDHMIKFAALDTMVDIYMKKESFDEALEIVNESLKNKINSFGENHISVITSKLMKATILASQEKFEEAKILGKENFEISNSILGTEHRLTQASRELLISSDIQIDMKLFLDEKYEEVISSILGNFNRSNTELGIEHKLTQTILKMLVKCYEILSDVEKEKYYKQFIVDEDEKLIELIIQNMLKGEENYKNGNYENAIPYYQEALDKQISILGTAHEDVIESYWNIALCNYMIDKYDDAIENYRKELGVRISMYGAKSEGVARAYLNIGDCYYWDDLYEDAIVEHDKARTILIELLGEEHEKVAECYHHLGLDYYWNEQYEAAISNYLNAFEIRKTLLGGKSEEADKSLYQLGKAYYLADKRKKANKCFSTVLKFRKKFYGPESKEYTEAKEWIEEL